MDGQLGGKRRVDPRPVVRAGDVGFQQDGELQRETEAAVFVAHEAVGEEGDVVVFLGGHAACAFEDAVESACGVPEERGLGVGFGVAFECGCAGGAVGAVHVAGASAEGARDGAACAADAGVGEGGGGVGEAGGGDVEFGAEVVFDGVEHGDEHADCALRVAALVGRALAVLILAVDEENASEIAHAGAHGCHAVAAGPEAVVACAVAEDEHQAHDDGKGWDDGRRDADMNAGKGVQPHD